MGCFHRFIEALNRRAVASLLEGHRIAVVGVVSFERMASAREVSIGIGVFWCIDLGT